jgi:hypothetical protein
MTNEELLKQLLGTTIERMGKQAMNYEAEIASLNSQIAILNEQIRQSKQNDTM